MVYFRRRVLHLIPVFFLVTFASFMMINLLPGDLVDAILLNEESAVPDAETRAILEKELNLDRPVVIRYGIWLGNLLRGNMGRSYVTQQPVTEALAQRIPVSLQLMLMSQFLALVIAIPVGLFTAFRAGKPVDRWISATAFAILSIPIFVVATALIYLFAIMLDWLPSSGHAQMSKDLWLNFKGFLLPAVSIAMIEIPILMRVLRTDMISTLQEDFIAFAKAKGMSNWYILFHHALRPSSFTLVTVLGLQLGRLIAGTIIIETLFSLPGVGKLLIDAVDNRDEIMVQGVITFIAIIYVIVNLIVDFLYAVLDPRVGLQSRGGGLR